MSVNNPYDAPKSIVDDVVQHSQSLDQVASGQKLIIYSILLSFASMAANTAFPPALVFALVLVTAVMSIVGAVRLCNGMGFSTLSKVLIIIGLLLPIVSLFVLVTLSIRATGRLKEAGYKVGLLGAKR
jgi:sorbitol-specific phosphotransferase system component IIC